MPKTILVIEEFPQLQDFCRDVLSQEEYAIITAGTFTTAQDMVLADPTIAAVVVDSAAGDGGVEESCNFIRTLRLNDYRNPIIAASSSRSFCQQMVNSGCDYSVDGEKYGIGDILTHALTENMLNPKQ
jgi:DNA-binding response OmpR family regulator